MKVQNIKTNSMRNDIANKKESISFTNNRRCLSSGREIIDSQFKLSQVKDQFIRERKFEGIRESAFNNTFMTPCLPGLNKWNRNIKFSRCADPELRFSQNAINRAIRNPELKESIHLVNNIHSGLENVSSHVKKKVKEARNTRFMPLCFLNKIKKKFGNDEFKLRTFSPQSKNRRPLINSEY